MHDRPYDLSARFGSASLVAGILLMLVGVGGFFLPNLVSLGAALFFAWAMIVGGLVWGYHALQSHPRDFIGWLKPVLLVVTGGLMVYSPLTGVAAVGLLLAVYLLLDAFGSFAFAHLLYRHKGWGWMVFNGIASLLLAMLFLMGWPETSLWLVGLYVGISLFFDGVALVVLGIAARSG